MTHILKDANILVTGGAGTLGRAIARKRRSEDWLGRLTVYSTDDHKHDVMRRQFPDQDIQYIQGDIRNSETLYAAMLGHDVVIHAAAVKVIPVSELYSIDTIDVNVYGSQNVCAAAVRAGVKHVLGISTDKACHPANLYGATKMAMEKIFQEYSRAHPGTAFHLVRYGNVLESTGSVVEAWRASVERHEPFKITDPSMTRFWLSPLQAAGYCAEAVEFETGLIYVPKMPSLSIGEMASMIVGAQEFVRIPLRPGEKMHETLVTCDELVRTWSFENCFFVNDSTIALEAVADRHPLARSAYTSEGARRLTAQELNQLLENA